MLCTGCAMVSAPRRNVEWPTMRPPRNAPSAGDSPNNPLAAAQALAQQIAARSPDALALTKALFHRSWTVSERRAFRIESALQLKLLLGRNHKEAIRANTAKRAPEFAPRSVA